MDDIFLFHNLFLTTVFVKNCRSLRSKSPCGKFFQGKKIPRPRSKIESNLFHSRVTACDANTFKRLFRNYRNARVNNEKVGGK